MGCNVCIGSGDCESPDFWSESIRTARKEHKCVECRKIIPKGEKYNILTGKWDGEMSSYKMCLTCREIESKLSCGGGGVVFGTLWYEIRESVFPNMSFACLEKLSIPAKKVMIEKWREYKEFQPA